MCNGNLQAVDEHKGRQAFHLHSNLTVQLPGAADMALYNQQRRTSKQVTGLNEERTNWL